MELRRMERTQRTLKTRSTINQMLTRQPYSSSHNLLSLTSVFISPQPLEKIYLRFKSPCQPYKKHDIRPKRYQSHLNPLNATSYHLKSLKDSQVRISNKTSYKKWRSPLETKQKENQFNGDDKLLQNTKSVYQPDQIFFDGEVKQINLGNQARTSGYGQNINFNLSNRKTQNTFKPTNPRLLAKTGIQKLTKQFQSLCKAPGRASKLAILPIESPLFVSHFEHTLSESEFYSSQDEILDKFKATNIHYKTDLRKENIELVRRIFQSLSNYGSFDIYSFIRYHVLFVTQEANATEKAYFLSNLFYQKNESTIQAQQFRRVLQIICSSGGQKNSQVQETVEGIMRLLASQAAQTQNKQKVPKSQIFRKLETYQDLGEVMVSLLCKK